MEDVIITAIVFTAIYQIIKVFTDYLLKRKIVNSGHVDNAGILEGPKNREENSYPTLKWGLVTLFAGLGLVITAFMNKGDNYNWMQGCRSYMALGIELVAISLGFLLYFIIIRFAKK